jgi:hypothetical protein
LAARYCVSSEQHPVAGQVHRDAARRVPGNGHRHSAVAEAELVAVGDLAVDPRRDHLVCRQLAHDLVVDGPFPVGQIRRRPGRSSADERGVSMVGEHLYRAPAGEVGRGPDVIGVEVRQHHPPHLCRLVSALADRVGDQRRGPGKAGVDEGEPVAIAPQVGVPDSEADEPQARQQLDDIHAATVSGRGADRPAFCRQQICCRHTAGHCGRLRGPPALHGPYALWTRSRPLARRTPLDVTRLRHRNRNPDGVHRSGRVSA